MRKNGVKKAIATTNNKLYRSTREKNPVSRFGYDNYMEIINDFMLKVVTVQEQETFSKTTKDPRWGKAMNEEMEVLCKNETWDRWIYKVKYNGDGSVNYYKA